MKALTLTVIANMTSNYGESLGNIASVHKLTKNRKIHSIRSKESLKNAIMQQSGMYDDLQTDVKGAAQKKVNAKLNASNCRALESGYMSTQENTYVRKSSFYITDAISVNHFNNISRFHTNLFLASNYAKANDKSVQSKLRDVGLMPYQYEYDKDLKIYSITIDLDRVGIDENFKDEDNKPAEASPMEKAERVIAIVDAIENLSLVVKGNLDNAEPIFIVGGLSDRKTHVFENSIKVDEGKLVINEALKNKVNNSFAAGLLGADIFENEDEIKEDLNTISVDEFIEKIRTDVKRHYGVE